MEAMKEQMTTMMEAMMSMRKMMEDNTAIVIAASTATEMDPIHPAGFNQVNHPVSDVVGQEGEVVKNAYGPHHVQVQFEQCHRPQKRRSGRVLRRKEEVEEVATDLGVGGDRLRRVSDTGAGDSSPLIPDNHLADDNEHDRHSSKDRDRHMCFFFTDDPRVSPHNSWISLVFTLLLLLVGLVSHFTIFNNLNAPYLCKKDGIVLHCPHVKESPSLWENPFSSTTSWMLSARMVFYQNFLLKMKQMAIYSSMLKVV
ncbi:uncharacterized protein LOC114391657 [Glycine soja]|uniref:uncharacterized protein LOC114391657 n=1 Tax=Glycine soja TaxID=3848 RepID=UPI00103AACC7|nr:uncharacterized protein LOC114391657 [Glycine soja]